MTSRKKKILEEILPLRFIREVEKWPVLYVRDCADMPNTHFKSKVWNEVAKALIGDWDTHSQAEKECKVSDLIKKWRNLRDTFKRQLLIDKKVRAGHNIKRKTYVYFKHMSFLLPHMKEGGAECTPAAPPPPPPPRRERVRAARSARTAHIDVEHIDEDRHFLMSLLPSLKRMNDDEKLTAKMEILKVIKEVRNSAAPTLDSYVCHLDLAAEEPLGVKKELCPPDLKSLSECFGFSGDTD